MTREKFIDFTKDHIIYLDGATGSNLVKAGMPSGVCPEQWILEHREVMLQLQKEYVQAGTNILYAPTFTANRVKLAEYHLEKNMSSMIHDLVAISKEAAASTPGHPVYVAGDITMTGEQLRRFMEWSAAFFKTWKPDEVTIAFDPSVRYYLYDAFEGVNYELDVSKEPGHRIKNLKWPNGKAVKDTDTFVVAVNNYRATTQLLTAADIFLPGEDLPKLLEIDVRGDVGGIRELLGEYIRTVKGGTIEPHVNNNWKIVGNNWKAADHQKAVQLLREGKLALNENADARTLPGKAITTADIAKF